MFHKRLQALVLLLITATIWWHQDLSVDFTEQRPSPVSPNHQSHSHRKHYTGHHEQHHCWNIKPGHYALLCNITICYIICDGKLQRDKSAYHCLTWKDGVPARISCTVMLAQVSNQSINNDRVNSEDVAHMDLYDKIFNNKPVGKKM